MQPASPAFSGQILLEATLRIILFHSWYSFQLYDRHTLYILSITTIVNLFKGR